MRDLTMVIPHYMNIGMLLEHRKIWASYPPELRAHLHVIVVDDCSEKGKRPGKKYVEVDGLGSMQVYRLLEKKRWNWLACRNLGSKLAKTEWLLMTDVDHALPVETLRTLIQGPLDPRNVYRFGRVDAPRRWPYTLSECAPYKGHPDTWLMTRALFFSPGVYGYDERMSGLYGTSGEFRDRVLKTARAHEMRSDVMIRYPREIIADASTPPSVYTRKGDKANDEEYRRRKALRELIPNWRPLHGLVKYEHLYSSVLEVAQVC